MPSWVWTDVVVTGDSAEAVGEFTKGECDANGKCTFSAPGDMRVALGFDGFVCNEDSAFVFTYVKNLDGTRVRVRARGGRCASGGGRGARAGLSASGGDGAGR